MIEDSWLSALGWIPLGAAVWFGMSGDRSTGWKWRLCLAMSFLMFRGNSLAVPHENSPDESQCLAGAMTLWHDPLFWRSVDGATAGPLHYYMLMPSALAPTPLIYGFARLTGYLVQLATFFLIGQVVRRVDWRAEAIVVSAGVTAFALSDATDFGHASTELMPGLLLAGMVATWLARRDSVLTAFGAGFALGSVPWAKLQAAPIAVALGLTMLVVELRARRRRQVFAIVLGSLLPTFFVAAMLTSTATWTDMLVPYVFANANYGAASGYTLWSAGRGLAQAMIEEGYSATWFVVGSGILGAIWLRRNAPQAAAFGEEKSAGRLEIWLSAIWSVTAIACVLAARRPFLHYWHLASVPLTLLVGVVLAREWAAGRIEDGGKIRFVIMVGCLTPLVICHFVRDKDFEGPRQLFARYGTEDRELVAAVSPYFERGGNDRLAIWGKRSGLYLTWGLPQATPQAHSELQLAPGKHQGYFLRAYWEAFARAKPVVFADATGKENLGFDSPLWSHETFRPLAEEVRRNYRLVVSRFGVRIYVRGDRWIDVAEVTGATGAP